MVLITDGGSTSCDWALLNKEGKLLMQTNTPGLNPNILSQGEIREIIASSEDLKSIFDKKLTIDFYGAGCGASESKKIVKSVLESLFINSEVTVREDTIVAVRAVTSKPGIVCILGTGSNSCYFDGTDVFHPIASLGYVLMDEASGNFFGKALINDYYYRRMPKDIASEFESNFNLDQDEILENLYKKDSPSAYLASFARFIFSENTHRLEEEYFHKLIVSAIELFVENRIKTFENAHDLPIHFVGSIAHFSKPVIAEVLQKHKLKLGNVVRYPIDGLIEYYSGQM